MSNTVSHTLVNPQDGNLAFKIFDFDGVCQFDHIQRLGYYSMILVREGGGKLKADFSAYDFSENMLMCFSPYQPFMLEEGASIKGVCVHFHPDFFCIHKHQQETACNGVLFNNIYDPPLFQLEPSETTSLVSVVEGMRTEMRNPGFSQYDLLISQLKILLITASRIKMNQNPKAAAEFSGRQQPVVLRHLKEAIETHFKSKHTPGDYAGLLHISPKALAKLCRNHFHKTLTDLIAERIVIEAKRELYLTSKSIKEIAWELGYEDEHYFSRFFKRNAAISPQFYRDTVGFARSEGFISEDVFSGASAN
jgi:AraC family transcriptional regulator, transcriptional activator of pobA